MRPESVEIKATLVGADVGEAVTALDLPDGREWRIVFCEDVTWGVAPSTPLLDIGVVLRARAKAGPKGDSTVKLRPCRWTQLSGDFFANREGDEHELKIEADWAGPRRTLAASLTAEWDDDRLAAVRSGGLPPAGLFSPEQRLFLDRCGNGSVNLDALTALDDITATRWKEIEAKIGDVDLSLRAERWVVEGAFDFLELSLVSDLNEAERHQAALHYLLAERFLTAEQSSENKTQRVLSYLTAHVGTG